MITAAETPLMTVEEFLAIPDDGMSRNLIRGEMREEEVTRRNPNHSFVEANVAAALRTWSRERQGPRGRVFSGEAGFLLKRQPDTTVGVDVAYVDAEAAARIPKTASLIDGAPTLAVEILSPSDKQEDILAKVQEYLAAGTKLVWLIEPVFETVTIYRPDALPVLLTGPQEIIGDPHLPGFRCVTAELFTA